MTTKLNPCPSCESEKLIHAYLGDKVKRVKCDSCGLTGPRNDMGGLKWNAMPRRDKWETTRLYDQKNYFPMWVILDDGRVTIAEWADAVDDIRYLFECLSNHKNNIEAGDSILDGSVTHWKPYHHPKPPEDTV